MAFISVIVPVFNVEAYLYRCVDSILEQTFTDFELILVDDGSPDRCGEMCDAYAEKDARVHVIHQKNGGLSAARNAGLDYVFAHSGSEWITFIDSDDWVHPAYLRSLFDAAVQCGNDIALCRYAVVSEEPQQTIPDFSVQRIDPQTLFVEQRGVAVIAPAKLYRKTLFAKERFPIGKLHEDEFLTYRLLFRCSELAFLTAELYCYFQNPDGIILRQTWDPKRSDATQAMWEQCRFFAKNKYINAEESTARLLIENASLNLQKLLELYSNETGRIKTTRSILRKALKKYKTKLDLNATNSEKVYYRLAFPIRTKLRKKWKHMIILFRGHING